MLNAALCCFCPPWPPAVHIQVHGARGVVHSTVLMNMAMIKNKEHKELIDMVRYAAKVTKTKCGIYIDLQGPTIRLG